MPLLLFLLVMASAVAVKALAEFKVALEQIGFGHAQQDAITESSGCTNITMLGLLSVDQLSKMCKWLDCQWMNPVWITTLQEQLLLQLPIVADDFSLAVALNQVQMMRQQLEDDARMDKEFVVKAPEKFKTASSWKVFSEALETYLGQILGSGWILLCYMIRRAENLDPDLLCSTEQEQAIVMDPLQGMVYQRDNIKVYGIIKQLVL